MVALHDTTAYHFSVTDDLVNLRREMTISRRAAFADSTQKGHVRQWKTYIKFCLHYGLRSLPSSSDTLSLYAQFLARSFQSVNAITNYVAGVKLMHVILQLPTTAFEAFEYKLTIKGLTRRKRHRVKQAAPITPQILYQFLQFLDLTQPSDATFWSLFLTAFFAMARKSNLVPASIKSYDAGKQLCRDRVLIGDQSLLLVWDWAKNIQAGERLHKVPLLQIPGSKLCPVRAYKNMCALVPAQGKSPAFSTLVKGKIVPITYSQFNRKIKQLITSCQLDPAQFSTHSFRRGGNICIQGKSTRTNDTTAG